MEKRKRISGQEYFYYESDVYWLVNKSEFDLFRDIPYHMALEFFEDTNFTVPGGRGKRFKAGYREKMILESSPSSRSFVTYNKREVKTILTESFNALYTGTTSGWKDSVLYYAAERVRKLCDFEEGE